jgi:hypothetical protein
MHKRLTKARITKAGLRSPSAWIASAGASPPPRNRTKPESQPDRGDKNEEYRFPTIFIVAQDSDCVVIERHDIRIHVRIIYQAETAKRDHDQTNAESGKTTVTAVSHDVHPRQD